MVRIRSFNGVIGPLFMRVLDALDVARCHVFIVARGTTHTATTTTRKGLSDADWAQCIARLGLKAL